MTNPGGAVTYANYNADDASFVYNFPPGIDLVALLGRTDGNVIDALGVVAEPTPNLPPQTTPVYRYILQNSSPNYYYTTDPASVPSGYVSDGANPMPFHAFSQNVLGTIPVYQTVSSLGQYLYSPFTGSQPDAVVAFYIYPVPAATSSGNGDSTVVDLDPPLGAVPLQHYSTGTVDDWNFYTIIGAGDSSNASAFNFIENIGFVIPQVVPVYSYVSAASPPIHFYSTDNPLSGSIPAGFSLNPAGSIAFYVFDQPVFGAVPIKCYKNPSGAYSYATSAGVLPGGANVWSYVQVAWFAHPTSISAPGASLLGFYQDSNSTDGFLTTNNSTVPGGYTQIVPDPRYGHTAPFQRTSR